MLALLVVIYHFGLDLAPISLSAMIVPFGPGNVAVMVFFMLSGFIILEAVTHFYARRPIPFLINRMFRLVPGFLAALALGVLVHFALWKAGILRSIDGKPLSVTIFAPIRLVENLLSIFPGLDRLGFQAEYEFLFLVWSLRAEMLFYLAVFGAVAVSAWFATDRYGQTVRWILAALALASLLVSMLSVAGLAPTIMQFAPYFVLGGALFEALRGNRGAIWIGLICLPLMVVQFWDYNAAVYAIHGRNRIGQFTLLGALAVAFAWLGGWSHWVSGRWDRRFGDLSYPLYLNHLTVGVAFRSFLPGRSLAAFVGGIAASIALSMAMQAMIEPMVKAWRDYWRGTSI